MYIQACIHKYLYLFLYLYIQQQCLFNIYNAGWHTDKNMYDEHVLFYFIEMKKKKKERKHQQFWVQLNAKYARVWEGVDKY